MTWAMVAIGGATVVGGLIASDASSRASNRAVGASEKATAENNALARDIYGQNKATLAPFVAQGTAANSNINALLGLGGDKAGAEKAFANYRDSTGYKFQLDQGNKAVTANAASAGLLKSGATLKALQERGQNLGAGYFANYLNTLIGQQGTGLNAAGATAGVGNTYSGQVMGSNVNNANNTANAALAGAANTNSLVNNTLGTLGYVYGMKN